LHITALYTFYFVFILGCSEWYLEFISTFHIGVLMLEHDVSDFTLCYV